MGGALGLGVLVAIIACICCCKCGSKEGKIYSKFLAIFLNFLFIITTLDCISLISRPSPSFWHLQYITRPGNRAILEWGEPGIENKLTILGTGPEVVYITPIPHLGVSEFI